MQGPVGGYYGPNQMRSDLRVLQSQVADVLVARNPAARVAALLDTARKLAGNIADAPAAERFRRVKKTNALITERVLGVEGGAQFMLVLGWEECEKGGGAFVCPPDADMDGMAQGLGVLAERLHRSGGGPAAPSPAVAELCQLASIPEAYARQLLEQHGMQLDKAVEAYFADAANGVVVRDPAPGGAPAAAAASSSAPVPVPTPPPRGRPAAPRRAPAAPAPAPAVPLPVPAEHIAEECSRLVSAIDQKKDERARARAAHPASVEAQANAVVEALVADGAAARAGAAAKVNALVKLRLAVTGAEEKAVLTNNILALLALSDDAAHRASLPGELRSLEGQLAALDADPAVAAMARSFAQPFASSSSTTTTATPQGSSPSNSSRPTTSPRSRCAAPPSRRSRALPTPCAWLRSTAGPAPRTTPSAASPPATSP
eukprot:TRINITY_DN7435_c1_g1_i1.p1 TRINITY_DN7435_c1_g1~~TRINITY_DN7435_c1_g1_i1.p1  ORF type:complete len:431 (+),score=108.73 TRINITY_DN7435_c1_g1_i1:78-1370(+)